MAVGVAVVAAVFVAGAVLDLGPFRPNPLSAAQLRLAGDEICADAQAQFTALQRHPPRTPADSAELTETLAAVASAELAELRALEIPASLQPEFDRYVAARERGLALLRSGTEAALEKNAGAYARAKSELDATQPRRHTLARAVGFRECSAPLVGG